LTKKIRIKTQSIGEILAEIVTDKNPKTAEAVWKALPINGTVNRWGEEIYFTIPVKVQDEKAQEEVDIGDLGYWPPGNAFCIFFGPTPVSTGAKPRAASPVNVFGKIIGETKSLTKVRSGEKIEVERVE